MDREAYVEAVLRVVEQIPPGRVMTYGSVADCVGGGPRQVGAVMAQYGGAVAWWRVVHADGRPPLGESGGAPEHYRAEGTALRPRPGGAATRSGGTTTRSGGTRIDLRTALWRPAEPPHPAGFAT